MPHSNHVQTTRFEVRFAETDASGLVHHGRYVPWLELGRVDWLRAVGADYAALERDGYHLAVVELRLRYVAPARFGEALAVRTGLVQARSRDAVFRQEVVTDEPHPRQLANATVRLICLHRGRMARLPEALRRVVEGEPGEEGA